MSRTKSLPVLLSLAVLAAAAALELGASGSHAAVSSNLNAYVHDDASIALQFADGTDVGTQARVPPVIPPGTYTIHVVDDTSEHNFDLTGPGVSMSTSVDGSETDNWTVTFQPGSSYRFQCDEHPDFMWGMFTTSGTATSTGSSSSSGSSSSGSTGSTGSTGSSSSGAGSTAQFNATLAASLATTGKATLSLGGKTVTKLAPGRYTVKVVDKSRTAGFLLQHTGHAATKLTTASFVGTHTATVNLTAGQWTFSSTVGKLKTTFVVT